MAHVKTGNKQEKGIKRLGCLQKPDIKSHKKTQIDFGKLFYEIDAEFKALHTDEERKEYACMLITPFADYLKAVKPVIHKMGETIDRAKEIEDGYRKILHEKHLEGNAEYMFGEIVSLVMTYSDLLEIYLLLNKISIYELQREIGLYLITERDHFVLHRIAHHVGTEQNAQRLIDRLNNQNQ